MPRYTVERELRGGGYYDWEAIETVLQRYARKLKTKIFVSLPHCETRDIVQQEGILFIYFYCCPSSNDASTTVLPSAYGFHLNGNQEDALRPVGNLTTVYDQNGIAVAEFTKGCIFVLFDLPHGPQSDLMTEKIMEDYLIFHSSPETFQEEMAKRIYELSMVNFQNLFKGELADQANRYDSRISEVESEIRNHQRNIISKTREREDLLKKRLAAKKVLESIDEKEITRKFRELEKYAVDRPVTVDRFCITVPVGQIYIEYEGDTYDIGMFDIKIFPDGSHGGVRCINRTREVNDYFHPHVDNDGDVCLGNISESIPELIGNMDYDIVIFMMIQFLSTCYEDGWYQEVTEWPKVGETEEQWQQRVNPEEE